MIISESINQGIKACFGESVTIVGRAYVGGGDINDACCLELSNGKSIFIKSNSVKNMGFFEAEEIGLTAIASSGTIRVPELLFRGVDDSSAFLAMEFVSGAKRVPGFWRKFGECLAKMHLADTSELVSDGKFGFDSDNYIGATVQINSPRDSWISFFRECRLKPQLKMAEHYFERSRISRILKLLDKLPQLLIEPEQPSLLHGDLWSGNYILYAMQ